MGQILSKLEKLYYLCKDMLRSGLIRAFSAVLAIWYIFCVVGFDVHTCNHSGRSFVASLVAGSSCEDIHPGCACDCWKHHHGPADSSLSDDMCCTNDIMVLALTGLDRTDESHHQHSHCSCICGHCPVLADVPCVGSVFRQCRSLTLPHDSRLFLPDILDSFSVLRI